MTPRIDHKALQPRSAAAMNRLDASVELDPVLRELVNLRASQINGCAFCIDMHTKDARAAGETEQRIYALDAWRETPFYTERERAALALTEAVTFVADGHVPDDVYRAAAEVFKDAELAALIWAAIVINTYNRIAIATRMQPGTYQPRPKTA